MSFEHTGGLRKHVIAGLDELLAGSDGGALIAAEDLCSAMLEACALGGNTEEPPPAEPRAVAFRKPRTDRRTDCHFYGRWN
jgi:hypothetical protein